MLAALAARDAKARKSEAVVAAADNFDLSELSEAAARIENASSWNDTDPQIVEYEDDDDDNCEEDVDWYSGDCDDELDGIAYTADTPTDDPELLEQFDGNVEDADASASQVYASASRSFQEARELLVRVKSARGYFPVVGSGAFDGLAQPSTDRKPVKSRGKGKKGKRKRKSSSQKGGKPRSLGTPGILPKTQSSRVDSRPPMSKKRPTEVGATRGGPHHAPRLRPGACCVDKLDIVLQNVPTKGNRLSHLENVHLVPVLWVVQCSIPSVMVQLSKKSNKIKTRKTLKILLRFQSRVWRGSSF